jgi:hypothetical protein
MKLLDLFESRFFYYGWITPHGHIQGDHSKIIADHFGEQILKDHGPLQSGYTLDDLVDSEHYGYGFKAGWVRVSRSQREVDFEIWHAKKAAFDHLIQMIKDFDETRLIGIQHRNTFDRFVNGREAIRWLNRMRKAIITEAEIPATEYGYWINPEGRYIPVPGYSHDTVAAKLFRTHPDIAVERAVQRGWIRVAARDDRFLSQMRSDVGKLPLRSLIELARKTPSDKYYFDFVADRNRGRSETFTEQGQAMRFLNELMRTRTA